LGYSSSNEIVVAWVDAPLFSVKGLVVFYGEIAMYLLGLSLVLLALKYFEVGPVAAWSWWWVLAPFGATALWWAWADSTGYTKRKAVEKMEQRKRERLDKQKEALGMRPRKPR
jgi:small Trp-rich protein